MLQLGRDDFREIAEEVLGSGKSLSFVAGGTSMAPFIKEGDTVTVRPERRLRIGDIALLRTPEDLLLLHRVVRTTKTGIITQGDACLCEDDFTPFEYVLGRAVRSSGLNFHFRFPFNALIARGGIRASRFRSLRFLFPLAKRLASLLG